MKAKLIMLEGGTRDVSKVKNHVSEVSWVYQCFLLLVLLNHMIYLK